MEGSALGLVPAEGEVAVKGLGWVAGAGESERVACSTGLDWLAVAKTSSVVMTLWRQQLPLAAQATRPVLAKHHLPNSDPTALLRLQNGPAVNLCPSYAHAICSLFLAVPLAVWLHYPPRLWASWLCHIR